MHGVAAALADADGAWVASGTAVLEAALLGVPAVALYVILRALIWYGQRMVKHRFITLPNLVLDREVVPELLQEDATPQRLAAAMEALHARSRASSTRSSPSCATALGPPDALETHRAVCRRAGARSARQPMMRIYHTSDLHDQRGFAPRLRALRDGAAGPALRLRRLAARQSDDVLRREPIIDEIDAAGYDAQAIGNREFHYLFSAAARARAREMQHPLVCTNLRDTKGARAAVLAVVRFTMRSRRRRGTRPRAGLADHAVSGTAAVGAHLRLALSRSVGCGRAVCVDTVPDGEMLIVLSHVGLALDRELAAARAAHRSDSRRTQPRYALRARVVDGVPIVHAGPYGQFVSRTELSTMRPRARFAVEDSRSFRC